MMEPTFEKLLVLLAEGEVRFVLVGGVAVTLHGYVRLTEDVDVLVESSDANVTRLLDSLSHYGEGFARELSLDDFADEEGAVRIVEESEMCPIDVFVRMTGLNYHDLIEDAETLELAGRSIHFASKAALKKLEEDPRAFD